MHDLLAELLAAEPDLLGPAPLFRLRGRHRRRLIVKSDQRLDSVTAVREAVASAVKARALRDVAISIDVDPQ
jgi:primosomal protein N' (replication factor Y)